MSVAVVVPMRNAAPWIEETLASIRAQSLAPREVVVVDDASSDDSPARVRRAGGAELVSSPRRGPGAARNAGLRATRSPYVSFLDADDLWHPEHLRILTDALEALPRTPGATTRMVGFREGRPPRWRPEGADAVTLVDPWAAFPLTLGGLQAPAAVLLRRESLEAAGGWEEGYPGLEDVMTWWRLSVRERFARVDACTAAHRSHPGSLTARARREGLPHLERFVEAGRALRAWRAARIADPEEIASRLDRRLLALEVGCAAFRAHERGEPDALADAAREFEGVLEREPDRFLDKLIGVSFWRLVPGGPEGRRRGSELARALEGSWPREAPRVRACLSRRVAWYARKAASDLGAAPPPAPGR